jgi:hypothetical protein
MRHFIIIAFIFLLSCNSKTVDTTKLTKSVWVNADLKFDTLHFDTSIYIVHGSGTLLRFDTTQTFKSLSNDFYLVDDTIAWGEPLANFKLGKWTVSNSIVIAANNYIEGSAMELLGKQTIDTFNIIGDTLITNNKEKYIRAKPLTKELIDIFNKDWPKYDKKNGK